LEARGKTERAARALLCLPEQQPGREVELRFRLWGSFGRAVQEGARVQCSHTSDVA